MRFYLPLFAACLGACLSSPKAGNGGDGGPSGIPGELSCSAAPTPVGAPLDIKDLLFTDPNTLVAVSGNNPQQSTRNFDGDFGAWQPFDGLPGEDASDFELFRYDGGAYAVLGELPEPQTGLRLCKLDDADTPCTDITIALAAGGFLEDRKLDDPSIATIDGSLVMVFNAYATGFVGDVYIATPRETDLTVWDATPIALTSTDGFDYDGPALAPDGSFIMVNTATSVETTPLLRVSYRTGTGLAEFGSFTAIAGTEGMLAEQLRNPDINFSENSIEIAANTRTDPDQVYIVECAR